MVIGKSKRAIEEHFYRNFELEAELFSKGKHEVAGGDQQDLRASPTSTSSGRRSSTGLGDAVSYARDHVGKEPFVLLLGDTLIGSNHPEKKPITRQMLDVYDRYEAPVVGLEEVERHKVERYGIIGGDPIEGQEGLFQLDQTGGEAIRSRSAPSNLAIAGRYIFTADIFDHIAKTPLRERMVRSS